MKFNEIMDTIKMLASSQGLYGRLLSSIEELTEEKKEELKSYLEAQNFKDPVDFVLWYEG